MDGERALALLFFLADPDLDLHRSLLGQDQGRAQGQLLDALRPGLRCSLQGQLEEAGAGQDGGGVDGVVGQPGVALQGEAAGQKPALFGGQGDQGAEQRVGGVALADRGRLGGPLGGLEPKALALEGVGGQGDALVGAQQPRPVDLGAV